MADQTVCPYCRMPFDEQGPAKIYCTACGMPHHEDCYQENGGCTVFGCPKAPADDPKLHVSYSDLQMPQQAVMTQPLMTQPINQPVMGASAPQLSARYGGGPLGLSAGAVSAAAAQQAVAGHNGTLPGTAAGAPAAYPAVIRQPKNRRTYILLGIFLGWAGGHNFYAGYTGRAVGQLCLSVLTLFYLAVISWVWAIIEICVVDQDSAGIEFS
ncbi:MAG TPA: NINE protein [Candidatus Angelobacter sp.]|nr:NINE protein [Candidatus Angelobacter sp.]